MSRGPLNITHYSAVTVPLRKCTCSHFLLFVWGGLALGRHWAKLEHQSALKARKKKKERNGANIGSPSPIATLSARHCVPPDGHAIYRYVANVATDGAAALKMNGAGDVRWVVMMAGDWRAVFFFSLSFSLLLLSLLPALCIFPRYWWLFALTRW